MSRILSQIIQIKVPCWNVDIFSYDLMLELCQEHGARHFEDPELEGKGEYTVFENEEDPKAEKVYFVVVNKKLKSVMKLWVSLHELGHHILHYPIPHKFSKSVTRKLDREANFFAAIALIPTWLLAERIKLYETVDRALGTIKGEFGYPKDLIRIRKDIFEAYKI